MGELLGDLCIDDGDVTMDWPRLWAGRQGRSEGSLPDWPERWPLTVRNVARWLDQSAGLSPFHPNAAE